MDTFIPQSDRVELINSNSGGYIVFLIYGDNGVQAQDTEAIRIDETYSITLHCALISRLSHFDQYDDTEISYDEWRAILDTWYMLCTAPFDEIFETLCGVDYAAGTVANKNMLWFLNQNGRFMMNERVEELAVYNDFKSWFEYFKDKGSIVYVRGI